MIDIQAVVDNLLRNQVVTGLSATAILGGIVYQIRNLPGRVFNFVYHNVISTLTVRSMDPAYSWVERWVTSQQFALTPRNLDLKTLDDESDDNEFGSRARQYLITPGSGSHWFRYKGTWVKVERSDNSPAPVSGGSAASSAGSQTSTISIVALTRNPKLVYDLIADAYHVATATCTVPIYLYRGWWSRLKGRGLRDLSTVVLNDGVLERILSDIALYEGARQWYKDRGLPYRRSYLFSGPPGTGKTSLVFALAGYLKRPLCVLNLGSVGSDDSLFSALTDSPANAIILLEDVDCANATASRDAPVPTVQPTVVGNSVAGATAEAPRKDASGVTKAGLLNALDGILTPENRIFIMTTNFPDRLDSALIRPGRVDLHEVLDLLTPEAQVRMAEKFYGHREFQPLPYNVSPVKLQAACIQCPLDHVAARLALLESITAPSGTTQLHLIA